MSTLMLGPTVTTYTPIFCKSNFSFLEGASHPEELVERAHELGLSALALTDRDGVYGVPRAHLRARDLGVKLLAGAEVTLGGGDARVGLLAQNREGYRNLCRLLTRGRLRMPKGQSEVRLDEVCEMAPGLLACWRDGCDGDAAEQLREAYGDRFYIVATRHHQADEPESEGRLRRLAARLRAPVAGAVEVLYHTKARRPLQDVLACLRMGVTLHGAGRVIRSNAEHALLAPRAFRELFTDCPEAIEHTLEIAARCEFSLDQVRYRYPSEQLPDGSTSAQWLRQLTFEGATQRYGDRHPQAVVRQLEKELAVIEQLDYPGYFLTMWEIVEFCRREGILCQGRGSAANSAVCFCLGITSIDPVKMDLLFERFLSLERHEPPDIDLDISHERREEVIQHVYRKYGRDYAAMVAVVIRYRVKSAIRDVGKTLGVPETALDRLAKLASRYDGSECAELLEHAGLDPEVPVHRQLVDLVDEIRDFPRHLSIHPGGFLLGHEPVCDLVPIENGSMEDRTVIQWDKDDVEALGLFKVDLLGLGALTLCDASFKLLRQHHGVDLDLARIPPEDQATYDMICQGDTVGVFQIESRAQMAMLPRLRPRTFYDLVIEVSIVRPGPISGDMVHPFLRRRHGQEPVSYPHKCLVPVLEKTLGVPLFQEQVMKLAVVAADYTPGEADQLRRDMAAWRKEGRIERHRVRLIERMRAKGIAPEFAERVFDQIRGFGEYGFPESHAASFALIAYATAWLRRHHPDVFTCALLNAQPMGFYSAATIVEDAKRHGVTVLPIDVCKSSWDCTLEPVDGVDILGLRMGLRWVKGLAGEAGQRIVSLARERQFETLAEFVRRTRLSEKQLTALGECGALAGFTEDRRAALWEAWKLSREPRDCLPFGEFGAAASESMSTTGFAPLDAFEMVTWDYRSSQHSPRSHPLEPLRPVLRGLGLIDSESIARLRNGRTASTAGLVICRQRPGTAKGVAFLTLEDESGFINVVLWQDVFESFAAVVKTSAFLAIRGKVQSEDGVTHLVAREVWIPRLEVAPLSGGSRDFH